jgi:hypothetical protein
MKMGNREPKVGPLTGTIEVVKINFFFHFHRGCRNIVQIAWICRDIQWLLHCTNTIKFTPCNTKGSCDVPSLFITRSATLSLWLSCANAPSTVCQPLLSVQDTGAAKTPSAAINVHPVQDSFSLSAGPTPLAANLDTNDTETRHLKNEDRFCKLQTALCLTDSLLTLSDWQSTDTLWLTLLALSDWLYWHSLTDSTDTVWLTVYWHCSHSNTGMSKHSHTKADCMILEADSRSALSPTPNILIAILIWRHTDICM